ncbi:hypothetical protein ACJZ2D_000611 [Fusarium nematophilum]
MPTLETGVIRELHLLAEDLDQERSTVVHVDWERDADFFAGRPLSPTTPPTKAAADNQLVLARAAALIIRVCRNNICRDGTFDVCSLSGYRSHLYRWVDSYNSSETSQTLLEDVATTVAIDILSSLQYMGVEGQLLSKIGPNLLPILQGKLDPIPLLLEADRLNRVCDGIETIQRLREHVGDYLSYYASKRPHMNVLEVGPIASNSTRAILKAFQGRELASYTIASSSTSLLQQIKSSLAQIDTVKLKALDINQDPRAQGFSPGSYDVIIVNNVLHKANALEEVLANVRQLLVPGGALVMVGMTDLSPAYSLIFGTMDNMWPDNLSPQLLLPSTAEWNQVLSDNGFSGLEPATKNFDRVGQASYCVVSTAVASTKRLPIRIIADAGGKLLSFADQLSSLLATSGTASMIGTLQDASAPNSVHVILDDGSSPLLSHPSWSAFVDSKTLDNAKVLWVSMRADGANSASESAMDMVAHMGRRIRKENETVKLVSLVVRQDYPGYKDILQVISRIIQISFQQERGSGCELEYEYRGDRVLVPRIRSAPMLSK